MNIVSNLDLLTVGIATAGNVLLGFTVLITNRKSATNILFFALTIVLTLWGITNYLSYQTTNPNLALFLVRMVLFFATPTSITFLILMHTFPSKKLKMPRYLFITLISAMIIVMGLVLTPLVFREVKVGLTGAPTPVPGPGIVLFFIVSVLSIPAGLYFIIRNYLNATGKEKKQFIFLLIGVVIMFACIITLNFILPTIFQNTQFIPLSAFFTFPFVMFTFYAILRHKLFNLRAAIVAFLTFILTISAGIEIIFSTGIFQVILRSSVFLFVLAVSILMNRFVETIAEQREELEQSNIQQENLIHFISHEVKGYLTIAQAAFAGIKEGDFGPVSPEMTTMVEGALTSTRKGSDTVKEILTAANLKKGTVPFQNIQFDMRPVVLDVVSQLKPTAEAKKLKIETNIHDDDFRLNGDKEQIEQHVIRNLIDNSIKYTLEGTVTVGLEKKDGKILFSVKDTGIGITPEDKEKLFTQGGRGKESTKVNVNSTGYGLYIAKNIVKAHNGRIWAESEGQGKGSQFYVEL